MLPHGNSLKWPEVVDLKYKNIIPGQLGKMAAVVKYVHSGAQASHNIQALVGSVFITLLILF